MLTDFHRYGFVERELSTRDRSWLLTVDFEAFTPVTTVAWIDAMRQWASLSAKGNWRFSFFLAVEDVVRLRSTRPEVWADFARAAKELEESGATFYPHNHGVFDAETGLLAPGRPERVVGYGKRASFVYDVVYRHGMDLREWLAQVVGHYDEFLGGAGMRRPERLVFRAGGWDHGDTAATARTYIQALEQNSFAVDSSASSGVFGTKTWRVGAPFGSNVFALSESVVEVAPCWSLNCGASFATRNAAAALARLLRQPRLLVRTAPGAFVTVLHFDHLFSAANGFAALPPRTEVNARVERFFRLMSILRGALQLDSKTFEDLTIES